MDPVYLIINAIVSGGSAYLGSYLKKKAENLATHEDIEKLVKQVEAVTTATKKIEEKVTRASFIYERQADILAALYRHLYEAQGLFRRMTTSGRLAGEPTPEQYAVRLDEAMEAASEEYLKGKLWISMALVQKCDAFFSTFANGRLTAHSARNMAMNPTQRAQFSDFATDIAHQEIPKMLEDIYTAARNLIHGDST